MKLEKPLVIEHDFMGHSKLVLEDHTLKHTFGKHETKIPLSTITGVTVKEARGTWRRGTITITIGSANAAYMRAGNFALGLGDYIMEVLTVEDNDTARKMRDYIMSYSTQPNQTSTSAADEIRKYKALCDDGIITQEEFENKKAGLLKGE